MVAGVCCSSGATALFVRCCLCRCADESLSDLSRAHAQGGWLYVRRLHAVQNQLVLALRTRWKRSPRMGVRGTAQHRICRGRYTHTTSSDQYSSRVLSLSALSCRCNRPKYEASDAGSEMSRYLFYFERYISLHKLFLSPSFYRVFSLACSSVALCCGCRPGTSTTARARKPRRSSCWPRRPRCSSWCPTACTLSRWTSSSMRPNSSYSADECSGQQTARQMACRTRRKRSGLE